MFKIKKNYLIVLTLLYCAFPRFTDLVNVHRICVYQTPSFWYIETGKHRLWLLRNSWILLPFLLPSAWLTALRQWWRWWPQDLLEEVVLKDPRSASNMYIHQKHTAYIISSSVRSRSDCVVCQNNSYLTWDVHSGSVSATPSNQESTSGDGLSWTSFFYMCCNLQTTNQGHRQCFFAGSHQEETAGPGEGDRSEWAVGRRCGGGQFALVHNLI